MRIFNARLGAWALLIFLLGSPFASILPAQTNPVIPFGEALDTVGTSMVWSTTGTPGWFGQSSVSHDGVDAAQSGVIPDNAWCGIKMTVNGPGTISFWWKVSSETNNDSLRFRIGNAEYAHISGEVDWQQVTMYAPGNGLTFEWRYTKNASLAAGQDRAWLDQVQFVPSPNSACSYYVSPRTTSHGYGATTGTVYIGTSSGCDWNVSKTNSWITILSAAGGVGNGYVVYALPPNTNMQSRSGNIMIGDAFFPLTQGGHSPVSAPVDQIVALGGTAVFSVAVDLTPPFTYQWQFNGVDIADGGGVSGATTSNLVLTGVQYSQGGNYRVVVSNSVSAAFSSSALLTVAPTSNTLPVAEALDTGTMFFWKTWADSRGNWFGQTNTAHDGIDALECSGLAPGAYASLEAKSGGAGILSFWWKSAFATPSDRLLFWIGSWQPAALTSTTDWEQHTFTVPPGDVNLRWTFANSSTGEQSRAWLDQVQFTPCGFSLSPSYGNWVTSLASTSTVTLNAAADCPWHIVNTNSWITILSSVTNSGSDTVIYAVAANPAAVSRSGNIVIAEKIFYIYQYSGSSTNAGIFLSEALDMGTPPDWSTIGTPEWFGQRIISRDGADAAQSGPVGNSNAVTATTTVMGPGTLLFWWKVSSETNKDYLKFFIDGVQQTRISGEVDWQLLSYNLFSGSNVLKWTYSKNDSVAVGQDRGWLDQVQFVPTPETGLCAVAISPISFTHSGNSETGSVYVVVAEGCGWDVVNTNSWITYLEGPGEGNGFVRYTVSANNSRNQRTGVILIGGRPFTVTQLNGLPACLSSISPSSRAHGYASGIGTISVTATFGCEWNVLNTNTWITITSSLSGSGNGQVTYSLSQNNSLASRSGQISIGGQIFTVSQSAAPITLAEALDTVGTPLVWITAGNGPWFGQSAMTHDGVDAAQSGALSVGAGSLQTTVTGPGTLTFWWKISSPETNSDLRFFVGSSQTARIFGEVNWQQQTVTIPPGVNNLQWIYTRTTAFSSGQNCGWVDQVQFVPTTGCPVTLSPGIASYPSSSSTGLVSVAAAVDCAWSVFNTNSWISIASGSNGTGNGSVTYILAANPASSVRSGNVRIADKLFFVTQSGTPPPCTISISPGSRTHWYASDAGTVSVTTQAGCTWNVFNSNAWISVNSSPSNSGSGQVIYSISENTTSFARSGNISIGGQLFSISQSSTNDTNLIALPEALDTTGTPLVWTTEGNMPWFGQTLFSHDGADAAQSGAIGDSSLHTTVNGPGTLSFWWKVSSATNSDTLRLYVNGVEQARISGEVDWQQRSLTVPAGSQALEWRYAKTSALYAGQDHGWVDQVQFVPATNTSCGIVLSPSSRTHGFGSVTNIFTVGAASTCNWEVLNTNAWILILSSLNGIGNGSVLYAVATNPTAFARSGNINVGGQNFLVIQTGSGSGCVISLSPTNASYGTGSSTGIVSVTVSGCAWGVVNTNPWVSIVSGTSTNGTGSGTLVYTVFANPSGSVRSGNIRIGGENFLITQLGDSTGCTISISPASRAHGPGNATGTVSVATQAGCAWSVVETNSWISLLSSPSNSTSGTVTYFVAPNTNSQARIGTIRIGGENFLVTQSGTSYGTNAPRLQLMSRTGTNATLSVQGEQGKMYVVQCSEDLIHWIPIGTNSAPSTVTDAAVGNAPQRFYRSVESP